MKRFQRVYTLVFSVLLLAFSTYAVLDTFVIARVYATVDQTVTGEASAVEQAAEADEETAPEQIEAAAEADEETAPEQIETAAGADTSRPQHLSAGYSRRKGPGSGGSPRGGDRPPSAPSYNDESASEASAPEAEAPEAAAEATVSEPEQSSSGSQITITQYNEYGSDIYVADIILDDISSLKTAFAQSSYGRNVTATTSETAEQAGAVLAVNGDNYGSREKGYVIRNGVLYRSAAAKDQEDLVIYADGTFEIIRESEITAEELLENGALHVFSFGPGLIEDGSITVSRNEEVDRARASNPRTAIGIIDKNHIVLVVSDGRTDESEGLSLYELAQFMQGLGVQTAYNLDGGGSSTMVYQGSLVNQPTSGGSIRERAVTDIIYIS